MYKTCNSWEIFRFAQCLKKISMEYNEGLSVCLSVSVNLWNSEMSSRFNFLLSPSPPIALSQSVCLCVSYSKSMCTWVSHTHVQARKKPYARLHDNKYFSFSILRTVFSKQLFYTILYFETRIADEPKIPPNYHNLKLFPSFSSY